MERLTKPPEVDINFWTFIKNIFGRLSPVEWIIDMITGVFNPDPNTGTAPGASATIRERLGYGATLLAMRYSQIDGHQSDIAALQDTAQKLLGVIGYGCWYANVALSDITGWGKVEFSTQVGPRVGCTNNGNGTVTLNSRGLWRVDAQVTFDGRVFGASDVETQIRVYAPNGTLFANKWYRVTDSTEVTITNIHSFVVPGPGYKVEVWAHSGTLRVLQGGVVNNGLNVIKVSDETS